MCCLRLVGKCPPLHPAVTLTIKSPWLFCCPRWQLLLLTGKADPDSTVSQEVVLRSCQRLWFVSLARKLTQSYFNSLIISFLPLFRGQGEAKQICFSTVMPKLFHIVLWVLQVPFFAFLRIHVWVLVKLNFCLVTEQKEGCRSLHS